MLSEACENKKASQALCTGRNELLHILVNKVCYSMQKRVTALNRLVSSTCDGSSNAA